MDRNVHVTRVNGEFRRHRSVDFKLDRVFWDLFVGLLCQVEEFVKTVLT